MSLERVPVENGGPRKRVPLKLRILLTVVALTVPADQLCKFLIETNLKYGDKVSIIDGFFYLTHARNPGAAFGLFGTAPTEMRMTAFIAVSVLAAVIIAAFYHHLAPGDRVQSLGLSFVFAGASANFIDRMWRGEVVDFLHFQLWAGYAWPDFNLADVCILVGVAALMIDLMSREAMARAA